MPGYMNGQYGSNKHAMERKQSTRVQTSILNGVEKKVLVWMAQRQPRWMTSDILTGIGTFGAVVIAAGYILSSVSINFLWLSSLGFIINWYGDSLDGTLARVRHRQRPVYGYYLDHTMDAINESIMFIGAGLSPFFNFTAAMIALVLYLMLSLNVSINAHLKSEFRLTYARLGPTEFRLIVIIINTVLILIGPASMGSAILDYITWGIVAILAVIYLVSVITDARGYSKADPMPEGNDGQQTM